EGHRRRCPTCGQSVVRMRDVLANREIRGPRNITSSNVDRIFDDDGRRFLVIEEKQPGEQIKAGQRRLLANLARLPQVDVWGVRGTPRSLSIKAHRPGVGWVPVLREGDVAAYEQCVHAWYAAERDDWRHALDLLSEVPVTSPAWCPDDLWSEFESALTKVLALRPQEDAA